MHAVPLNPLTFEDNIYLGHTEVSASVGVVWAYSEGLPLMGRQIVMENCLDYCVSEILYSFRIQSEIICPLSVN